MHPHQLGALLMLVGLMLLASGLYLTPAIPWLRHWTTEEQQRAELARFTGFLGSLLWIAGLWMWLWTF